MAGNCTPTRPAAAIRYDLFEEASYETPIPSANPESEEPRIHISLKRENPSVRNLANLNLSSVHRTTSINPLHFKEASSLRSPSTEKMTQESLPDLYRKSVKCMNKIIKEALPKSKQRAQALFAEAEKVQTLLPQHRDKVLSALRT